jgi:hypothetical protein
MAHKPETGFTHSIHRYVPAAVYYMKNNNPYCAGVPDVWYSGKKGDLWIEYKWLAQKPVKSFTPDLSKLQSKWLGARHDEGRNVAVIVGFTGGAIVLTTPIEWDSVVLINDHTILTNKEVAEWIIHECA